MHGGATFKGFFYLAVLRGSLKFVMVFSLKIKKRLFKICNGLNFGGHFSYSLFSFLSSFGFLIRMHIYNSLAEERLIEVVLLKLSRNVRIMVVDCACLDHNHAYQLIKMLKNSFYFHKYMGACHSITFLYQFGRLV